MKYARLLLITLGVFAVVGALALTLALTPSLQRWAVLRAAAGQPGLKLEVEHVSAGFSTLSLHGVRLAQNGLLVQLDSLETDYSLVQLVFSRRLVIHQLTATGLMMDASRVSRAKAGAAATGGPVAAPGLLARLELPVALELEDCRLTGRALLPGAAGQPPIEADYKITGGKFSPGQAGALLLSATIRNPAADAHVAALNAEVSLRATQTQRRAFDRISLTAVVDAEGKTFSEQNQLKISATLSRDQAGENYSASVDTLIHGTAANLLTLQAALPAGQKEYAGQWTLKASAPQVEPFVLGVALPDFDVRGAGRFAVKPGTRSVSLQGNLAVAASRLEAIDPSWRAIGPVKLEAQFDLAETDGVARLRQLELQLSGDQPVLELHASSAAEFNLLEGRLKVGGSTAGDVLSLQLHGLPVAWVRPFIHEADVSGGMITGRLMVSAEPDRLLLRAAEPLKVDGLTVVQEGRVLLAKAAVSLNPEVVLTGQEVQVRISEFKLSTAAGDAVAARLTITAPLSENPAMAISVGGTADLPALLAPWLPWGPVKATGETDFTLTGAKVDLPNAEPGVDLARGKIELRRLGATVTDAAGAPYFQAAALRAFDFDLATRQTAGHEKSAVDLMRFTFGHIPLGSVAAGQPGAQVGGKVEQGEFVLTADGDKLSLHAVSAFKLADVSLTQDGQRALTGLAIEALPVFELTGGIGGRVQTGEVTVKDTTGATVVTLRGEGTHTEAAGLHGNLTFALEVPTLARQPLFAGTEAVAQGHVSGEVRVALGAARQVEARLTMNGLVSAASGQTLPVANLSFRAIAQADGKLSVQAPLLLDRGGQRSDLNFALELAPAGRGFTLDGKLAGEHVELADALSLLGVFLTSAAAVEQPVGPVTSPPALAADAVAAWSRFNGQLALDVKSVTRGKDWSMTGLTGLVQLTPARVTLTRLDAAFGEKSRFKSAGELKFTAGAQPYALAGDFSLTEFDAGKFFKAIEPAKPAALEGIFAVNGHLEGQGASVGQTAEQTRGRFELTSRQGVFRGLQRTSSKVSMTSKAVELGASVFGSIFGSDKVTKAAEKVAGSAYFVDQLAQSVAELKYDQLSLRLVRDESLNVTLEDISLIAPEIRLLGKGTVTYTAGKPLLDQPLSLSLAFAGRGKIEQLLGKLRLLDGTKDELGYAKTQLPVTVAGSLAKPDPSAYFTKIATAKLSEILSPDN